MLGHRRRVSRLDKARGGLLVVIERALKKGGEALRARMLRKRVDPFPARQIACSRGGFGGDAMPERLEQRVVFDQAFQTRERIGAQRARGLDHAVGELHIGDGSAVLVGAHAQAVHAACHKAHEGSGDLIDARVGDQLAHGWVVGDGGAIALELEHEDVKVALDDRVHLAARAGEVAVNLLNAPLLGVHKGVRVAVEHVVREQAECPCAANAGVGGLQVRNTVAQRGELA